MFQYLQASDKRGYELNNLLWICIRTSYRTLLVQVASVHPNLPKLYLPDSIPLMLKTRI